MNKETLEYALEHSMDQNDYPDVFPEDFGMDFHLEDHPEYYPKKSGCYQEGDKRKLVIELSTYKGLCWNAMHYYAYIKAGGIDICRDEIDEKGVKHVWYVGLGNKLQNLPRAKQAEYSSRYNIEVSHVLTQEDLDKYPERWEDYDVGDKTYAFETKEEALQTAIKVAKARFPKGWKIEIDDNT